MVKKYIAIVGIAFLVLVFLVMPFVSSSTIGSDCVMIKPSAYEGGASICVRMPSEILRGWNAAAAYNLGYEKMTDGTYKKVVD